MEEMFRQIAFMFPEFEKYFSAGFIVFARLLGFIHPTTKKYMEFEAPLPDYFQELLRKLQ